MVPRCRSIVASPLGFAAAARVAHLGRCAGRIRIIANERDNHSQLLRVIISRFDVFMTKRVAAMGPAKKPLRTDAAEDAAD
jgi:hypothetical protein